MGPVNLKFQLLFKHCFTDHSQQSQNHPGQCDKGWERTRNSLKEKAYFSSFLNQASKTYLFIVTDPIFSDMDKERRHFWNWERSREKMSSSSMVTYSCSCVREYWTFLISTPTLLCWHGCVRPAGSGRSCLCSGPFAVPTNSEM